MSSVQKVMEDFSDKVVVLPLPYFEVKVKTVASYYCFALSTLSYEPIKLTLYTFELLSNAT